MFKTLAERMAYVAGLAGEWLDSDDAASCALVAAWEAGRAARRAGAR